MANYARLIAIGLRLPKQEIENVVKCGLLHDVGKIGVRNDRLNKPGKLTPEELAMFRSHHCSERPGVCTALFQPPVAVPPAFT